MFRGRASRSILFVVGLVVLGLLAWLLLQRTESARGDGDALSGDSAVDAPPSASLDGAGEAVVVKGARTALATDPVEAELPAPQPSLAAGPILSGRLVDEVGSAIAGGTVFISVPQMPSYTKRRQFGAPVIGTVVDGAWVDGLHAVTDADGRFALQPTLVGLVHFAARAPGCAPLDVDPLGVPPSGKNLGDIEMQRGLRLAGSVVNLRGVGLAGADLFARATKDENEAAVWMRAGVTKTDGTFDLDGLPLGRWGLLVESKEHPPYVASGTCDGLECTGVELVVADGYAIRGRVEGAAQFGMPVFVLATYSRPEGVAYDAEVMRSRLVEVAADGAFEMFGLSGPGGKWTLRAQAKHHDPVMASPLAPVLVVPPGTEGVVLTIHPTTQYQVRAIDARSGASLALQPGWVQIDNSFTVKTSPGGPVDGVTTFDAMVPANAKTLFVQLAAEGYDYSVLTLAPALVGGMQDLGTVAFEPSLLMTVRLLDADTRAPIAGAVVNVSNREYRHPKASREPTSVPAMHAEVRTDANGERQFARALGSATTLTVRAEGYVGLKRDIEAPINKDPQRIELELERGGSLAVLVWVGQERATDCIVRLTSAASSDHDAFHREVPTDESGTARFENLATGQHRVAVISSSGAWRERGASDIQLDGGHETFEIRLPPSTSLAGVITSRGRPLAGATVRGLLRAVPGKNAGQGERYFPDAGEVRTSGAGRFTLAELEPGRRELVIEHPSLPIPARWSIEIESGRNEGAFDVGLAELRGRAVDASGTPVSGCAIELALDVGASMPRGFQTKKGPHRVQTTTDTKGAFAFADLPPGVPMSIAPKDSVFVVPPTSLTLAASELRDDLVLVLERGGDLHVTLVRPDGKPVAGELVVERGTNRRSERGYATEARFQLAPGEWVVTLRPWDTADPTTIAGPFSVIVSAGETAELSIPVPIPETRR